MATVEELRKSVTRQNDPEWNKIVDSLIIAVEKRMKERILDASVAKFNMGGGIYVMIRTSVLDPEETDNAKQG